MTTASRHTPAHSATDQKTCRRRDEDGSHRQLDSRASLAAICGLLISAVLLAPLPADAFAHQHTEAGARAHWVQRKVEFAVASSGNMPSKARELVVTAFQTWQKALGANLELTFTGYSSGSTGYDESLPKANENLVTWRAKGWEHHPQALALTFVHYKLNSGEIVDADIEINAEHHKFAFTLQGEGQGTGVDLQSVITHEAGHFLGLAHSEHPQATMHASVAAGETNKRSLHEDDRTGLNALYGREASWRSALALEEKKDRSLTQEELGVSCSVAGRMGSAVPWSMALPAILGLLMMVKRRFRG